MLRAENAQRSLMQRPEEEEEAEGELNRRRVLISLRQMAPPPPPLLLLLAVGGRPSARAPANTCTASHHLGATISQPQSVDRRKINTQPPGERGQICRR